MAGINQDYLGNLTNHLSQVFQSNVGIGGAPLTACTTEITDADSPNSVVSIALMLENVKGRTAQVLVKGDLPDTDVTVGGATSTAQGGVGVQAGDPTYRTYTDYEDPNQATIGETGDTQYGKARYQSFRIFPEFIQEGMYRFTLAELENLNDDNFIRTIVQKTLFETVRRQVMMRFYQKLFAPWYFVDTTQSTHASNKLTLKLNGVITDYDQFGIKAFGRIYTNLRKRLLDAVNEGDGLKLIGTPDLVGGISDASDNLNWLNYSGSLKTLQNRQYPMLKNIGIHEADLVDTLQNIKHGGLSWENSRSSLTIASNKITGHTAGTAPGENHVFPHLTSETNSALWTADSTATDYKTTTVFTGTSEAPVQTLPIVGVCMSKRALGMGIWKRWDASRFAGNSLGTVTSFFKDPLSGVQFRLETYYLPTAQEYRIVCSCKVGFTQMDFRAAELVFFKAN